jgi:hypothetical protein
MIVPLDPQAISCSRVDDAHLLGDVARLASVLARLQLADLPRAVHLVAEAPVAHVVRLLVAVGAPQLAPLRPASRLQYSTYATAISAVPVPKFIPSSGSVPTSRHQSMNSLVPNWFVSIEFHAARAPSAAAPSVRRRRASCSRRRSCRLDSGRGNAELLYFPRHVRAKTARIGERQSRLDRPRIDGPAQVLEERAEETPIER